MSKPIVIVEVNGGVADAEGYEGATAFLLDWDNAEEDTEESIRYLAHAEGEINALLVQRSDPMTRERLNRMLAGVQAGIVSIRKRLRGDL